MDEHSNAHRLQPLLGTSRLALRSLVLLAVLGGFACKDKDPDPGQAIPARATRSTPPVEDESSVGVPVPPGVATEPNVVLPFAIYYLPKAKKEPGKVLRRLVEKEYSALAVLAPGKPGKAPSVELVEPDVVDVSPPSEENLKWLGRGIGQDQARAVQDSKQVVLLKFNLDGDERLKLHELAMALTHKLAVETGALLLERKGK